MQLSAMPETQDKLIEYDAYMPVDWLVELSSCILVTWVIFKHLSV